MEHQSELVKAQDVQIVSTGFAEIAKTWIPTVISLAALFITAVTSIVSLNYRVGSLETRFGRYEERQVQIEQVLDQIHTDVRVTRERMELLHQKELKELSYNGGK